MTGGGAEFEYLLTRNMVLSRKIMIFLLRFAGKWVEGLMD